ncbi:histidine kinase dimerization/phospho-acceptor domain-containing protein [Variovorax sp. GB1P17]|uniref:histidine kinase dimerization/phospho-acceptor domain-containing protein n=1 Tax=Variovorax sp. GB1P17 TaxID=3443740 RepID=UPI003F48B613
MAAWNAAIAHELRTPLTILQGRLQGMSDCVFPPSQDRFRDCWRMSRASRNSSMTCASLPCRTAGTCTCASNR